MTTHYTWELTLSARASMLGYTCRWVHVWGAALAGVAPPGTGTISLRRRGGSGSLCGRKTVHRQSALFSRVAMSSDEGGGDRVYKCGTPGGASRHGGDSILRHSAQGEESAVVGTES